MEKQPNWKQDFKQFRIYFIHKLNLIDLNWVVGIMRNLWIRRNDYIHNNKFFRSRMLVQRAKEEMDEFQLANMNIHPGTDVQARREVRWSPPEDMGIKVN